MPLAKLVDFLSKIAGIAADDFTLKLALFHTLFNFLGVLIMIPFIHRLERFLIRFIKESRRKDIDEPKYLNKAILEFPGTLVTSLEKETRYLFENPIIEIIAHALNIHRTDLISELGIKTVVKKSQKDIEVNVRELYLRKVKSIYGQILEYATIGQAELTLEAPQNQRIAEIKIANRKMVEIIRDVKELRINVLKYTQSDNTHMRSQYERFRRLIAKVLRAVNQMKDAEDPIKIKNEIKELKKFFKAKMKSNNKSIDKLIRENLIDVNMASSLVNDHDNVNDMIKMILEVCELLYVQKDSLFEPTEPAPDRVPHSTD
jgi:phosphate:Na+ symporter